jgi:hypothetical protein
MIPPPAPVPPSGGTPKHASMRRAKMALSYVRFVVAGSWVCHRTRHGAQVVG